MSPPIGFERLCDATAAGLARIRPAYWNPTAVWHRAGIPAGAATAGAAASARPLDAAAKLPGPARAC